MHRSHRVQRHTGVRVRPGEISVENNTSRLRELRSQLDLDLNPILDTATESHRTVVLRPVEPQTARDYGVSRLMHPDLPDLPVVGEQQQRSLYGRNNDGTGWGNYSDDDGDDDSDNGEPNHEGRWQQRRAVRAAKLVGPRVRAMARAERTGIPVHETLRSIDERAQIQREKMRYQLAVRSVSNKRATIDTGLGAAVTPADDLRFMQDRLESMMTQQKESLAKRRVVNVPRLAFDKLQPTGRRIPTEPTTARGKPPPIRRVFK
jgi:hypothetical protein